MKYYTLILICLLFSCSNEKSILLPEITQSDLSEIQDVSAAYLFYDITQKDSIELNRKNLIISTHWLINVDKRLTLKQAMPKIIFLQEKKRNAEMHKNENAKNYYTCNNTSAKYLGFIEFTDVVYHENNLVESGLGNYLIIFKSPEDIQIVTADNKIFNTTESLLLNVLSTSLSNKIGPVTLFLAFNKNVLFQNYITCKSIINQLESENVIVANDEYLFN